MSEFTALGIAGATLLTGKSPFGAQRYPSEGEWLPYRTGEVKSHLEQLDSVGSAAVVCHRGQLYAFITAAENLHPDDTDALLARVRAQLAVQLPYYLLPQHFFFSRCCR